MNEYQQTMYNDLMNLVENSESFYYADRELDSTWYRLFNYRMCSYTEFLAPNALECRGHMFRISCEGPTAEVVAFVSLPVEKFFNLYENPFTMDLDLSEMKYAMLKADGSLISTYMHNACWFNCTPGDAGVVLRLKTKGSLESDQAIAAMEWLDRPENKSFKNELIGAERLNCTVNMEWCAPDNRIVIGYEEPHLVVLNVRSRETGEYVDYADIDAEHFPEILFHWVEFEEVDDKVKFINQIPGLQDIEGYVIQLNSGQHVKIKTTWYLALHHTKDSINTPRRLYEAVLAEGTDDMRSLFHDDPVAIKMIEEMELFVEQKYNHIVDTVERYYERNKDMERKDYAILGQKELKGKEFGLAMMKYTGKDVDYKEFMTKNWKYFGLKDEKVEVE